MNPLQRAFVLLIKAGNFATPASAKLYQVAFSCLGTDASPMNVAVFMINASGGWRSGAGGMFVPGTPGTKRAFIGGMTEMMKDTTIDKDGGDKKDFRT